jgi:DUF4097 and DUF4098 domain-containing protein YvlB
VAKEGDIQITTEKGNIDLVTTKGVINIRGPVIGLNG